MMDDFGLGIVVSMKDAFSQNASRVQSSMQALDSAVAASAERMTRNMDRIQEGTMMVGAGLAMMALPTALIASTAATQKALGEMASLGVKDLRALGDAAESFSNTWAGTNKADFIAASYDVKSAISTLSDEAVGAFTSMAATTSKATKSSVNEMVGTFTTAYGIFKPMMAKYSDMDWAKTFAGAMSQTVASFKTTGAQMADAIKNIGAVAAASNIPLEEQLAILGQLQTTMPGSEAGTLYKSFIMKAAEAGESLGLSFIDSTGRLKGVVSIIQELSTKFPDLSQAAAQVQLKKAFGSDEAVKFLLQMSQGVGTLEGNIGSIRKAMQEGSAAAEQMATAMNMDIGSQLTLLRQQMSNLAEILGRTLLPIITPIIQGISKGILFVQQLAKSMPGLTRVILSASMAIGTVLVVFGGAIAAAGTIGLMLPAIKVGLLAMGSAIAGVGTAFTTFFFPVVAVIGGVMLSVYLLKRAWESNFGGIRDTVLGAWEKMRLVFQGIKALVGSLSGGVGQISAELAEKLESAGLMGFVTTVFRVYYRVREFLTGLSQAFSTSFGKIIEIIGPAVRGLMDAYGALYKAVFSILEVFGLVATSTDASAYKSLGRTLGTLVGVIAQVGAYVIKFLVFPLTAAIRIITPVVRAIVWLGKTLATVFIDGSKFIYKFFLPLRMLGQAVQSAGRVLYSFWQIMTGDISLLDGLKRIGGAIVDFLVTPFRWAKDVVVGVWGVLSSIVTGIGRLFAKTAGLIMDTFTELPIVQPLIDLFGAVRNFLTGNTTFFEAGKQMLISLGKGILSTAMYPFNMLKSALGWLRKLLPFSDAKIGPLSNLTQSGESIFRTIANGMLKTINLPGKILGSAFSGLLNFGDLNLASAVGDSLKSVPNTIGNALRMASDSMSMAWGRMKQMAAGMGSYLVSPFQDIGKVADGAWTRMVNSAGNAMEKLKTAFAGISLSAMATKWKSDLFAPLQNLGDVTKAFWNGLGNQSRDVAAQFVGVFLGIKNTAGIVWDHMSDAASTMWNSIKTRALRASEWLAMPFTQISRAWSAIKMPEMNSAAVFKMDFAGFDNSVFSRIGQSLSGLAETSKAAFDNVASSVSGTLSFIGSTASVLWEQFKSPFQNFASFSTQVWGQIKGTAVSAWEAIKSIFTTMAGTVFESGRAVLSTLGDGIRSAIMEPYNAITSALSKVRDLLPFSDAKEGPLSNLTKSGVALAETFSKGISQAAEKPAKELEKSFGLMEAIRGFSVPALAAGTLALTPVLADPPPVIASPMAAEYKQVETALNGTLALTPVLAGPPPIMASPMPMEYRPADTDFNQTLAVAPITAQTIPVFPEPEPIRQDDPFASPAQMPQSRAILLAETRGSKGQSASESSPKSDISIDPLFNALIAKLDMISDRPIQVSLTVDGRQIAQAVYKDARERKIRNYETLSS